MNPYCYICAGRSGLVKRAVSQRAEITVCIDCAERWKLRTIDEVARIATYAEAPEPHTLESWPPRLTWGNR